MAFDPALPADATKLRLGPGVIRDNWEAIEEGLASFKPEAINLNNRTPLVPPNDPVAIAETYILYSKDDALGNPELYGINQASQKTQFTRGATTAASAESSIFLPGTEPGMIMKMGLGSFVGAAITGSVVYGTAFPNNAYGVTATIVGTNLIVNVENTSVLTGFTIARSAAAPAGPSFHWIAWGN